jgi:hypothetical protein
MKKRNKEVSRVMEKKKEMSRVMEKKRRRRKKKSRVEIALEWVNEGSRTLKEIEIVLREAAIDKEEEEESRLLAKYHLATIYLQTNRREEGLELARELGFRYVIKSDIWNVLSKTRSGDSYVGAADEVLSKSRFESLFKVFAPKSSFWTEHNYPTPSFFSYYISLGDKKQNLLLEIVRDYVIPIVSKTFPKAKDCVGFEFWAHKRLNGSGHQMHYDTDEILQRTGRVSHPVVSCVLCLEEGHGGCTLVTTHRLEEGEDKIEKTSGFLLRPKTNRLNYFSGDLLHGVVPVVKEMSSKKQRGAKRSRISVVKERITLMIGLWLETPKSYVEAKRRKNDRLVVPCMELPQRHRWITLLRHFPERNKKEKKHYRRLNRFEYVSKLWQKLLKSSVNPLARNMFSVGGFFVFDLKDLDRALLGVRGVLDEDEEEEEEEEQEEEWGSVADILRMQQQQKQ